MILYSVYLSDTCFIVSSRLSAGSDASSVNQSHRSSTSNNNNADLVQSRRSSIGFDALASIKNSLMNKFTYLRRSSIVSERGQNSLWISESNKSDNRSGANQRKCSTLPDNRRTWSTRSATLPDNYRLSAPFDHRIENQNRRSCSSIPESAIAYVSSRRRLYTATPGRSFICVKSYRAREEGELRMRKGTFVEGRYANVEVHLEHGCAYLKFCIFCEIREGVLCFFLPDVEFVVI